MRVCNKGEEVPKLSVYMYEIVKNENTIQVNIKKS